MSDEDFLREAIRVGNLQDAPRNFGAVIVKDGQIIAVEHNHVRESNDPTAHAETSAIRVACQKLGTYNLEGCTMYGSHEPCLMCFSCAAWARLDRVVYDKSASDVDDFTYEFEGVSLQDLAAKQTRQHVRVEQVRITD
jgi:tRNA(Arg) A34 adenosine deaminase TadA